MTGFKESLEWARTIGSIRGNVEYLKEKVERGEVAGCGEFADINQKCLTRVLEEVTALLDQQRDLLENM